jgi:hypothetical protein
VEHDVFSLIGLGSDEDVYKNGQPSIAQYVVGLIRRKTAEIVPANRGEYIERRY